MTFLQSDKAKLLAKVLFFSVVVYFPLFLHLENLPIRLWDESRLAVSAYEMAKSGDYIVTTFEGKPDMWSTKPPFMIWLQALSIKLFGAGELAVRLPAALAALFTCLGLLLFSARFMKNFWLGMLAVLILVTSGGYVDVHVSRSGDFDVMLALGTTFSALFFFRYTETGESKFLYYTVLFLIIAALTKGVAALIFLPAFFLYAALKRKLLPLIKNPHLYASVFLFVLFVGGFYLLREHYNPGYLDAIKENELGGRYFETLEGHKQPYWFYFNNFMTRHFNPWLILLPVAVLLGLLHKQQVIRNLTLFLTLLILVYFFVISGAKTRIEWYDVPMLPPMALLAAIFLSFWFDFLSGQTLFSNYLKVNVVPYALMFLVFVVPYTHIIQKVYKPEEAWIIEYNFTRYLQKGFHGKIDLNNHFICLDRYHGSAVFYKNVLQDKGVNIDFADYKTLKPGAIAMVVYPEVRREIERRYETTTLEEKSHLKIYRIDIAYDCSNE